MTRNLEKEEREFRVDKNIIYHLIQSQSGNLSSAMVELIQNSYDAGASYCSIHIDNDGFVCDDDGKGFTDRQEVENFFETFGTPHAKESSTRFGRFRMGRGQIMVHAKTTWITGGFRMDVDIKENGLKYHLETLEATKKPGCKIEGKFYEHTRPAQIHYEIEKLQERCEFIYPLVVHINGQKVSLDQKAGEWTFENEDFFYRHEPTMWGDPTLRVHNMGVFVAAMQVGVSGTLVTKKHLTLNTSRNHILENCPLWKAILPELTPYLPEFQKTGRLTKSEKLHILGRICTGESLIKDAYDLKLFADSNEVRYYSIRELVKSDRPIAIAPFPHSGEADQLLKMGIATVLSPEIFIAMGNTLAVRERDPGPGVRRLILMARTQDSNAAQAADRMFSSIKPSKAYSRYLDEDTCLVPDSKLKKVELVAIKSIRKAYTASKKHIRSIIKGYCAYEGIPEFNMNLERKLVVGISDENAGWTDGASYIAINRIYLADLNRGPALASHLANLLIHEICHIDDDPKHHDAEFYERFHTLSLGTPGAPSQLVARLSANMMNHYGLGLEEAGMRVPFAVKASIKKSRIRGVAPRRPGDVQ